MIASNADVVQKNLAQIWRKIALLDMKCLNFRRIERFLIVSD